MREYVDNGFKVGPNYDRPPAPVAQHWIDADDVRVRSQRDDLSKWWVVFKDPVLDSLICFAYRQNLSLRVAACRVLEARAQMSIDTGNLFPQTQTMTGDYTRTVLSREVANSFAPGLKRWYGQWDYGFNLSWELDFWGRLRRAIESDSATLDASVENYDDVLVTLLGDVATNYVTYRTTEQRIKYAKENVAFQQQHVTDRRRIIRRLVSRTISTCSRCGAPWSKPRLPSRSWRLPDAKPRINSASCWAFLLKTCKLGSAQGRSPPRPRK